MIVTAYRYDGSIQGDLEVPVGKSEQLIGDISGRCASVQTNDGSKYWNTGVQEVSMVQGNKPWDTDHLTGIFMRETGLRLGRKLTMADYRHIAIAIDREHV